HVGDKIKAGDIIADGAATEQGELALGRNVLMAFMPWYGYNFEDAIIISEKLLREDAYTSIYIEEFEITARDTKLGREEITRDIPNVPEEQLINLGDDGIIRIGAEVKPGDILVGKITPKTETELAPEERLLRAIFGEKAADVKDASLIAPPGTEGVVMEVKEFSRRDRLSSSKSDEELVEEAAKLKEVQREYKSEKGELKRETHEKVGALLINEQAPDTIVHRRTADVIVAKGELITQEVLDALEKEEVEDLIMPACELYDAFKKLIHCAATAAEDLENRYKAQLEFLRKGDSDLEPGVVRQVKVYIATKRKLQVGDKMAGRHGNKGVVSNIVPEADMPFLPNGETVEVILNPLGVPSRLNMGQLFETHLGIAAKKLGVYVKCPVFEGFPEKRIWEMMKEAQLPETGKMHLYDGLTGDRFDNTSVVGYIYLLKLGHLVADKIHARSVGPYSLVTQQPLGGKAQMGGQRFGEMEVWAAEAYGAAHLLQELLTVKSDDVPGRTRIYESIVKGENILKSGTPESFNVLIKEMQGLGLDVRPEQIIEEIAVEAESQTSQSQGEKE
ncbi:MAG: DNA-directed RNA polymerase subunit beta, partial [Chlamydiia bacterium]|nr:DNA-directed RNA polymerase subunit beta [Chlamydiia bacterium]